MRAAARYTWEMRSTRVVLVVLGLAGGACKDDVPAPAATHEPPAKQAPAPAEVQATVSLPATFPLPADGRTLVRFADKLAMTTWEYAYASRSPDALLATIKAGMQPPAFTLEDAPAGSVVATHGGRRYAVTTRADGDRTLATVRAYPEAGPPTTPPPAAYPVAFPFVAGGTASHAQDGGALRVAYQSDPSDLRTATRVAAQAAGWQCDAGTAKTACAKGARTVTFSVEPASGGSVLVVSAR